MSMEVRLCVDQLPPWLAAFIVIASNIVLSLWCFKVNVMSPNSKSQNMTNLVIRSYVATVAS